MSRIVLFLVVALLGSACAGDDGPESAASPRATAPAITETTTTTMTAVTTTTESMTTTTDRYADCPPLRVSTTEMGDPYDPGCYKGTLGGRGPKFVVTFEDPTWVLTGEYFTEYEFHPEAPVIRIPPVANLKLHLTKYSFLYSYDGDEAVEIEVPDDPTAHIESHPYLEVISGPESVEVGGHEAVQFDVIVTGVPDGLDTLRFGGYDQHPTFVVWDLGEELRITFVMVDGEPIWMMTLGSGPEESFEKATEFHDTIVAAIEFT